MEEDDVLTPREVAKKLRISLATVYKMINTGELPALRVGRSIRIPDKVVKQIFKIQTVSQFSGTNFGRKAVVKYCSE